MSRPKPSRASVVTTLAWLAALGPLTLDLFLPALPEIQREFHTGSAQIQLAVGGAALGFALGQLVIGPLSDAFGRRVPIVTATSLHLLASIAVALSQDIFAMSLSRFVQGMACTAAGVIIIGIAHDLYRGETLLRTLADLTVATAIAPIAAPLLGSVLVICVGWRGLSIFVAVWALAGSIAVLVLLPETLGRDRRVAPGLGEAWRRYLSLFADRQFLLILLGDSMLWATLFAYLSASPFLLQGSAGLSVLGYGAVVTVITAASTIAGQVSSRLLLRRWGPRRVLLCGGAGVFVGALGLLGSSTIWARELWALGGSFLFVVASFSVAVPTIAILVLDSFGHQPATTFALLGAVNCGVAALIGPLIGVLGVSTPAPLAALTGVTAVLVMGSAAALLARRRGVGIA